MTLPLNHWSILFFLTLGQGLFLSLILMFHHKFKQHRWLAVFLFLVTLMVGEYGLIWTQTLHQLPFFSAITFHFIYLYGPLMYLYVGSFQKSQKKPKFIWSHFMLFGVMLLLSMPYYLKDPSIKAMVIQKKLYNGEVFHSASHIFQTILQVGHLIVYWVFTYRRLKKMHHQTTDQTMTKVLRRIFRAYSIFAGVYILYAFILVSHLPYTPWVCFGISLSITYIIYWLVYLAFDIPQFFFAKLAAPRKAAKYAKSVLTKDKAAHYAKLLQEKMQEEQWFRNGDLRSKDLAESLGVSVHHLSQVLNESLQSNFYDFVNAYRVEAAKQLLIDEERKQDTILGIGLEVGFNSKNSFNNAFKKMTQMTPSQYKEQHLIV